MKVQNRGLSFKLADIFHVRGRGWLCHWVNRDVCPGSLESFREAGRGEEHDRKSGSVLELHVASCECPNRPSSRPWSALYKKNNRKTLFSGFRHI